MHSDDQPPDAGLRYLMNPILLLVMTLLSAISLHAQSSTQETAVRKAVQSFYDAFNSHDFTRVPEFTTEDWTHINPMGGWTRGRDAVLKNLKEVHSTFLKGVIDTVEEMEVRACY